MAGAGAVLRGNRRAGLRVDGSRVAAVSRAVPRKGPGRRVAEEEGRGFPDLGHVHVQDVGERAVVFVEDGIVIRGLRLEETILTVLGGIHGVAGHAQGAGEQGELKRLVFDDQESHV